MKQDDSFRLLSEQAAFDIFIVVCLVAAMFSPYLR